MAAKKKMPPELLERFKKKSEKKQGYNARSDESLGARNGKKSQSLKSRRDESKGAEKAAGKRAYSGNKSSAQGKAPAKGSMKEKMAALRAKKKK